MKERSSVIAIVVVLAICCLGAYVAVTGYLNSQPPAGGANPVGVIVSPVMTVLPTETLVAAKPAVVAPTIPATAVAVPSPLGAFQTITAAVPILPAPPTAPRTIAPAAPAATATPAAPACNSPFCPRGGPPDITIGPGNTECPANYIFGRVVDSSGKGIPDIRIRFKDPTGDGGTTSTKSPSPYDPAGAYNIPTGQPGSAWFVWVEVNGTMASPQVSVSTQRYTGTGNCPTRLDFVQQK